jgi:hypothetical protein
MANTFDPRLGKYRDEGGRFVAERTIRDAVDNLADLSSERMAALAQRLQAGSLMLADFQTQAMVEIKSAHLAAGIAAHGGRAQMAPADYGFLGRHIRDEYAFLRQFADDIASGKQPLDGRLINRARMYGQAARSTFEAVRRRDERNRGNDEERNVLHGGDHCSLCPDLSARGWVPIDSLPPIGSRPCGPYDRCTLSFRVAPAVSEAA